MSVNATVGVYNGQAADHNADARKMFTERANQQDGLAAILTYCQNKVGFHVGSTDTIPLRQVIKDEFSGILVYQQNLSSSQLEKTFANGITPTAEDLGEYFANEYIMKIFIAILMAMTGSYISLVQLIVRAETQLTLEISEVYTIRADSSSKVIGFHNFWVVDREQMARRADELMDKLKLRESIGDWAKKITSNGW